MSRERRRLGSNSFRSNSVSRSLPCLKTAVEHARIRMAEVLEKPHRPCRPHAGILLIKNYGFVLVDTAQFEYVVDHVHKCLERRFTSVDQAQTKKIPMNCSWNVPPGEVFGRPDVH